MILGLCGKAYSGKDTFGTLLSNQLLNFDNDPYILMAYAGELKLRCQKDFDLSYDQLWGSEKETNDLRYPKKGHDFSSNPGDYWTAREIMQAYGEFYRSIDYDFWVKNLFKVIAEKDYKNVIITDVRHLNEAYAVKEHGGFLIKLTREGTPRPHGETHPSEVALDNYTDYDFYVVNNWGFDELKKAASETAELIIQLNKTKGV